MTPQDAFKSSVVDAARELVAVAGLSHLPLLQALAELRRLQEEQNAVDFTEWCRAPHTGSNATKHSPE